MTQREPQSLEQESTPTRPAASRRRVLIAGGVAGAGAAAALALRPSAPAPEATAAQAPADPATAPDGYRLTDHIRRYYQTAKV